ncbi:YbjQ family protein [Antarctobacter jejuensis]|uniref:YbjQ family protein n=1 Tax=Antarctobacter jejuensis TaxID=1439938 RepID=UPI003FD3E10B
MGCVEDARLKARAEKVSAVAEIDNDLRRRADALLLTTEPTLDQVESRIGIVSGCSALGMHIFRDLTAEIRDVIGGRSGAYEKAMREARDFALSDMRIQAAELNADAVVSVDISVSEVTGGGGLFGGKGMLLVFASGTAVKLTGQ